MVPLDQVGGELAGRGEFPVALGPEIPMPEQPASMGVIAAGQLGGVLLRDLSAIIIVHATPPATAGTEGRHRS